MKDNVSHEAQHSVVLKASSSVESHIPSDDLHSIGLFELLVDCTHSTNSRFPFPLNTSADLQRTFVNRFPAA